MSLVGAGTTAPTRALLSVPVLVSNSMTDGTMLVFSQRDRAVQCVLDRGEFDRVGDIRIGSHSQKLTCQLVRSHLKSLSRFGFHLWRGSTAISANRGP